MSSVDNLLLSASDGKVNADHNSTIALERSDLDHCYYAESKRALQSFHAVEAEAHEKIAGSAVDSGTQQKRTMRVGYAEILTNRLPLKGSPIETSKFSCMYRFGEVSAERL